jgi:hypothetical protein
MAAGSSDAKLTLNLTAGRGIPEDTHLHTRPIQNMNSREKNVLSRCIFLCVQFGVNTEELKFLCGIALIPERTAYSDALL